MKIAVKVSLRAAFFLLLVVSAAGLFAQQGDSGVQKYALVIGNGNYTGISKLNNSVNDANDVAAALQALGFNVDKIVNGSLEQMENSVMNFKRRLGGSKDTYGFFFYAGHGVQANGVNYLIPIDASNILNETHLRSRAVSLQFVMDSLDEAGNQLNMIVLDACRDNPFGWSRSGSRGLSVLSGAPAGSIVMYATSANSTASDGTGRNGLFTGQLLNNLKTPGLTVYDVFNKTGEDVLKASAGKQHPELSLRFFGANTAYLGAKPEAAVQTAPAPEPAQVAVQPSPMPAPAPAAPVPTPTPTPKRPAKERPAKERDKDADNAARLMSVGASLGTSFAAPLLIGTVHGTISPLRNTFFDVGVDFGVISGDDKYDYYSFYPFAHFAYFRPFGKNNGWYGAAGAGFMLATYNFPAAEVKDHTFAADACAGIIINNKFNISYTMRTNFTSASNKLAVGYIYRFK